MKSRTFYVVEEFDQEMDSIGQSDPFSTQAEARANVRGKRAPVIFEWTMYGTEDEQGFTVERDDFRAVWRSLEFNRIAKRQRLEVFA